MNKPLISIITIVYNGETHLQETIDSVQAQDYSHIEYLVIDGGSSDNTLGIIQQNESAITRWISEPDEGISDAMNKGIRLAQGDYLLFLHSDDRLHNRSVIACAVNGMSELSDLYIYQVLLDRHGVKRLSANRGLGVWTNLKMGSCHQGHLVSRRVFDRVGEFDVSLNIVMDYDLMLRAYRAGISSVSVDAVLSDMRLIGISSGLDWDSLQRRFREEKKVHFKQADTGLKRLFYRGYWPAYWCYRLVSYWLRSRH